MKKIDLHIHTIPTISDSQFTFSLDSFKRYVVEQKLDAIAVTNHDMFDAAQFKRIQAELKCVALPGIEINVNKGHVLVIDGGQELDDFESKTRLVSQRITKIGDSISVAELKSIFGDLNRYLIIPHFEKAPALSGQALTDLLPFISAGEVDSPKKFIRSIKDKTSLSPVLFSDARMMVGLATLPARQTFVDCGNITIAALKASLRDKGKVALSERDGNNLWQALDNGQQLSTGLNVLVGARSSGKTHALDEIDQKVERTKYIRQFSLVQQDDALDEREFKNSVENRRSVFVDQYLLGFKRVVDEIVDVNLDSNDREISKYVETLLRSAEEANRRDAYSKSALFDEVELPESDTATLEALIGSVRQVIENLEYREVIEKHIQLSTLKQLACELIQLLWAKAFENQKRKTVNAVIRDVKSGLRVRTSAIQVADFDLYKAAMDERRIRRFTEMVNFLKRPEVVFEENVQGFRVEARKEPYAGPGELRLASGQKTAFSEAFQKYDRPYEFLQELLKKEDLSRSDLYKFFAKIGYRILNRDGFEVSGGERSEYRLLQEIADAQNYDILLIDEPESSFDNLFLNSDVNKVIKEISQTMPVVVVTHNSTVGASVGPDYLLHTRKEIEDGKPIYRIYSGYPTDRELKSVDGKAIGSHAVLLDSLEAGVDAYEGRRDTYESAKN